MPNPSAPALQAQPAWLQSFYQLGFILPTSNGREIKTNPHARLAIHLLPGEDFIFLIYRMWVCVSPPLLNSRED